MTVEAGTDWDVNLQHIKEEIEHLETDLAALREQLKRSRERAEGRVPDEYLRAYV